MEREWTDELIAEYAVGGFRDTRLKKQERNCSMGWSQSKSSVCGAWAARAPERCAMAASCEMPK
jgi:hypothetical protein